MEQALHWEDLRAQWVRSKRAGGSGEGPGSFSCMKPGEIGLSGAAPVGTQTEVVEEGHSARAVDPQE